MLEFLIENHDNYIDNYAGDFFSVILEDVCESNYVDNSKVLEAVNEKFSTDFADVEQLTDWEPVDVEELRYLAGLHGTMNPDDVDYTTTRADVVPGKYPDLMN